MEAKTLTPISAFLGSRQNIFLTGVTGFLGKVILHKLLTVILAQGDSKTMISVLIRPSSKKGHPARERFVQEVLQTPIFEQMYKQYPQFPQRVQVLEGDISGENFNFSKEDLKKLQASVDVILHCAATTRFTENLKLAFELNVLGVRRMVEFAKGCPNLVSVVHVSTCFVNAHKTDGRAIEEKIFPLAGKSYQEVIEYVMSLRAEEVDKVTPAVIKPYPNTYTFSKSIGERVVQAEKGNLPLCILRPSIVTAALAEPLPGWVDALLGASGLFITTGLGVLHVMHGGANVIADYIPVDYISNSVLAACWRNTTLKTDWSKTLPIYQVSSGTRNPVTWYTPQTLVPHYFRRHRPKKAIGYPWAYMVPNPYLYKLMHATVHLMPAALMDAKRTLQGKKRVMYKNITRLEATISSLSYFTGNNWLFKSDNVEVLLQSMDPEDLKLFPFDVKNIKWDFYILTYVDGIRKYLLQEDEEALVPKSKL